MMQRLLVVMIVCMGLVGTTAFAAESANFKIIESSDAILVWTPWAAKWRRAGQGSVLTEGSLIQVPNGVSVSFEPLFKTGFKGLKGKAVIKIIKPVVMRLERDIFRPVELNTSFTDSLADMSKVKVKGDVPTYSDMTEAWSKSALIYSGKSWWQSIQDKFQLNKRSIEVGVQAKEIRLISPPNDVVLEKENMPSRIKIVWRHINQPKPEYQIRLWKKGEDEDEGTLLAVTELDYYTLTVSRSGIYFVQIATEDGNYQSKVHRVTVMTPLDRFFSKTSLDELRDSKEDEIKLLFPKDTMSIVSVNDPSAVQFSWQIHDNLPYEQLEKTELVLFDDDENEVYSSAMTSTHKMLWLKPGGYAWQIRLKARLSGRSEPQTILSKLNSFTISPKKQSTTSYLKRLLVEKRTGSFYLSDGL